MVEPFTHVPRKHSARLAVKHVAKYVAKNARNVVKRGAKIDAEHV